MRRALEIAAGIGLASLAGWVSDRAPIATPPALAASGAPSAPLSVASSKASEERGAEAPPADSTREQTPLERPDPVASYTLRASLDPDAHTIHGEGSIAWRNASHVPQSELFVHLYLNAFKNERTIFLRRKDEGFRGGGEVRDHGSIDVRRFHVRELDADVWPTEPVTPGDPEDATDIRVPLPRAVPPGASITIDVAWDAKLPSIALRTGYLGRFHMAGQWFPKLARLEEDGRWAHFPFYRLSEFYADFGAYDVTIDTPDSFQVGATGRLLSEERASGRVARRFAQEDVHDFAFAAWDQFREATTKTDDGIAIRCLYPPGHDRSASIEIEAARFGLDYFGRVFGRYPYATLTIVHPPEGADEAGGMEYPTLITTGGEWYMPWTGAHLVEDVTLHELAHQWFYGLVATNEHAHPFLDEGLTTYAEIDAMEALFPGASIGSVWGVSIGLPAVHRAVSLEVDQDAPVAQAASDFVTGFDYGGLVYARTATALLSLSAVRGPDALRAAIGRYARSYRFRHPGPDALLATIREDLGDVAADALRVALFDRGWVDYSVSEVSSSGAALVRRRGSIVLPVDVDLIGEDGSVERVAWDAKKSAVWLSYHGASPLAAAVVDPARLVLLDKDLSNNAARAGGEGFGARSLERALFAAELGLHLVSP